MLGIFSLLCLAIYNLHSACIFEEFSLERQIKKETHHFFLKSQALVSEDLDESSKKSFKLNQYTKFKV